MNKRAKKKAEKRRRALAHQILDVVLDINGVEPRQKEYTGNMPTAFFEFSGHTAGVDIDIRRSGWDYGQPIEVYEHGCLSRPGSAEGVLAKAKSEAAALREKGVIS